MSLAHATGPTLPGPRYRQPPSCARLGEWETVSRRWRWCAQTKWSPRKKNKQTQLGPFSAEHCTFAHADTWRSRQISTSWDFIRWLCFCCCCCCCCWLSSLHWVYVCCCVCQPSDILETSSYPRITYIYKQIMIQECADPFGYG